MLLGGAGGVGMSFVCALLCSYSPAGGVLMGWFAAAAVASGIGGAILLIVGFVVYYDN